MIHTFNRMKTEYSPHHSRNVNSEAITILKFREKMETKDHIHGQEPPTEESSAGDEVLDHRLSLLHLDHCPMALTAAADAPPQPSTVAYGNTTPLKRRSSTLTLSPPGSAGKSPYGALLSRGYSVLKLPAGGNAATSLRPPLCRCSYASTSNNPARRSLFPAHPLARSASDPVTLSQFQNPRNNQSPASQESPSSKRRKRIDRIERMKQMKEWVDEIVQEHEQNAACCSSIPTQDKVLDDNKGNDEREEAGYEEGKNEEREAEEEEDMVSAKRVGEFTQLNLKCPCGCGFKVLIIGHSCFYKLI